MNIPECVPDEYDVRYWNGCPFFSEIVCERNDPGSGRAPDETFECPSPTSGLPGYPRAFRPSWQAVDNVRYAADGTTALFDFYADFRDPRPYLTYVPIRSDSWMGAETDGTTFPVLVRVHDGATLTVEANTALTFAAGLSVDYGARLVVEEGATLRFGPGKKLNGLGVVEIRGAPGAPVLLARQTTTPAQAWGGVLLRGDGSEVVYARVEEATTGVEVRAQGVLIEGATLTANGTGLLTDYDGPGGGAGASAAQRSSVTVAGSCLVGNTGVGLLARYADFGTTDYLRITQNGAQGLLADDATFPIVLRSIVNQNGAAVDVGASGLSLLYGGALALFAQFHPNDGYNRIANNVGDEIAAASGALLYVGVGTATDSMGTNRISDGSGGVLVRNSTGSAVWARHTYWGTGGAPPAGALVGPVNAGFPLGSDPTGPFPTACIGFGGGGAGARAGGELMPSALLASGDGPATDTSVVPDPGAAEALRQAIRDARGALAQAAAAGGAAGGAAPEAVRELYGWQRLDPDDVLGEHAQTMALLTAIRAGLDAPELPAEERPAAEAALVVEADEALRTSDLAEATALLDGYTALVTGPDAVRALALRRATVDEAGGDYVSALAAYGAEAVLLDLDGEAALAAAYRQVAAVVAARALEADSALVVLPPPGGVEAGAALPTEYALRAAYPNPSSASFTVPVALPATAAVRAEAFDLLGRRVAVLADGPLEAGVHRLVLDGSRLAAGVYVIRAVVTPERGEPRTFAQRLTVVR